MKNTKHLGVIRYIDEEHGYAVIRTEIGNFIVDASELKSAGVKWKTCLPDIVIEFSFSKNSNDQILLSLHSRADSLNGKKIKARLEQGKAA